MGCKEVLNIDIKLSYVGFTLTMWDVKNILSSLYLEIVPVFYLNYVGCKGIKERLLNA